MSSLRPRASIASCRCQHCGGKLSRFKDGEQSERYCPACLSFRPAGAYDPDEDVILTGPPAAALRGPDPVQHVWELLQLIRQRAAELPDDPPPCELQKLDFQYALQDAIWSFTQYQATRRPR
jgi:hypothetical protein